MVVAPSTAGINDGNLTFDKVGILTRCEHHINEAVGIRYKNELFITVNVVEEILPWSPDFLIPVEAEESSKAAKSVRLKSRSQSSRRMRKGGSVSVGNVEGLSDPIENNAYINEDEGGRNTGKGVENTNLDSDGSGPRKKKKRRRSGALNGPKEVNIESIGLSFGRCPDLNLIFNSVVVDNIVEMTTSKEGRGGESESTNMAQSIPGVLKCQIQNRDTMDPE
ncbi:hypothetical protein E3N88_13074 [Mikania micrantha]|uniref:Uncharacterized protein n=1 Tax=Mikania micrantha TaxID=192012 RepID=A0A5N6P7J5_9ASTR|nr:hypothetical protein E3N88_13074 [Mikania micrantha]